MTGRRPSPALAFLLFALFVAALAVLPNRELLLGRVPVGRDLPFYFAPTKAHLGEALRAWEVPWVDRYRWGGVPLLASPGAATFYPPSLLFAVLPLGTALTAWILLHRVIALGGFALLASRLGLSPEAALAAGLAYALGGVSASLAPFLGATSGYAILPWFAAALVDLRRDASRRNAVRAAAATGLLALTAVPEVLLLAAPLAIALLAWPLERGSASSRAVLPRAAAALALGLSLGAAALLPALEGARDSVRGPGGGMNLLVAAQGSLAPRRLVEIASDGLVADWTAVAAADGVREYPYLPSLTPGRVALLLALAGLAARGPRLRMLALAAGGVLFALGPATSVWPLAARAFPPLLALRYPEKFFIISGFALAALSALGLGALERRLPARFRRLALAGLCGLLFLDRERTVRRLLLAEAPSVLTEAPAILRGLPHGVPDAPPPRLFHADSYAPAPIYDLRDLAASQHAALATLMPGYASLFGVGYVFEPDYDFTLPQQAFEWVRLLKTAVPGGTRLVEGLYRRVGVTAVVASEVDGGRATPRVRPLEDPLPPFRFAGRVVEDDDGRRLFARLLEDGFDPDTAYVQGRGGSRRPLARGSLLGVQDRPSGLVLDVEVPAGHDGYLSLFRLHAACEEAELDGRPVEVDDSFGFAGVRVPEGRHRLRLRPSTVWVKLGAALSAVSALALFLLHRWPRRKSGSAAPGPDPLG